jgi:hypothetical protein
MFAIANLPPFWIILWELSLVVFAIIVILVPLVV